MDYDTDLASEVHEIEGEVCNISRAALLRVLEGVAVATKTAPEDVANISRCIDSIPTPSTSAHGVQDAETRETDFARDSFSFFEWHQMLSVKFNAARSRCIVTLVLCVAYLRQHSRQTQCAPVPPKTMSYIWKLVHGVLTDTSIDPPPCTPVRSAQGFFTIILCSLISNGTIDELFRLHVWLPDIRRRNQDYRIHSHQPFAQSWILAGEGIDMSFDTEVTSEDSATHAEAVPAWSDGNTLSTTYKTHQTISTIMKTGVFMCAHPSTSTTHTRDMTYTIPHAKYHSSVVRSDTLHATLFFFDSSRGFKQDAPVLIPKTLGPIIQRREVIGTTAAQLASTVDSFRHWEKLLERGREHAQSGRLDEAADKFTDALDLCGLFEDGVNPAEFRGITVRELDNVRSRMREVLRPKVMGGELRNAYVRQVPIAIVEGR